MKFKLLLLLLIPAAFLLNASVAKADLCTTDTKVNVVARDPGGVYIPGIKAEIYTQVIDANGATKPGTKMASASANASTGIATLTFRNRDAQQAIYALRIQSISKEFTSYWYYNLTLNCGEEVSVDKTLSGINFVLRDYNGDLLYNTKFNVYSQKYDADGNPIKQSKDLVASLDSGNSGSAQIYVPQGSVRSIDGNQGDYYMLEMTRDRKVFSLYDIKVLDGLMTFSEYYSSAVKITLRTSLGALFPSGTKIQVYQQTIDSDNNDAQGDQVGEFVTNDEGYGIFEYPAGLYVLGIKNDSSQYNYLWDVEIMEGQLNEYDWQVGNNVQTGNETCSESSQLTLNLIGINGDPLSAFKYEIYEQDADVFGRPIPGRKIKSGTTNSAGRAELVFKPDSRKSYVVKVYDKKSDVGEFWFFDAARFTCGYDRAVTKSLPYLRIILRDGQGNLKTNASFSLYEQSFDVDNNPIKATNKLVTSMKTGNDGSAIMYVAPAHSFDQNRRGLYVLSATIGKTVFDAYNIAVTANQNATFEYVFSDLSLSLKSAAGQALANKEVKLKAQVKDGNKYLLGDELSSGKTDDSGLLQFEYPAGTYALVVTDDFKQDNIFWDVVIKDRQSNRATLSANLTRVSLSHPLGEMSSLGSALTVYSLYENGGYFYKDKEVGTIKLSSTKQGEALLADGPYLISYVDKSKVEYGQAFWAENDKLNTIKIKIEKTQQIDVGQKFSVTKPARATAIVSSSPTTTGNSASTNLSKRLAGYILLQVEDKGKAWYLNPTDSKRYYLANGAGAYQIMRKAGVGITDKDLSKIPIGVDARFAKGDSDGDLLPDGLEVSIGSDPHNSDSDGDGFLDGAEVRDSYNPIGSGRLNYDLNFANKLKGKILLQVQKNGEAWYVNPADGKRYYLGNGDLAFQIMRYLSLGISNQNLATINVGQ
ncbi:MAG: hypothetical protein PHE20_00925 [Patescibacteria group bacterium]|nr:hypothetical protein [Patescibacteria group bacterium]